MPDTIRAKPARENTVLGLGFACFRGGRRVSVLDGDLEAFYRQVFRGYVGFFVAQTNARQLFNGH